MPDRREEQTGSSERVTRSEGNNEVEALAEELLREHWRSMGLDPDGMASLLELVVELGERERERWSAAAGERHGRDQ